MDVGAEPVIAGALDAAAMKAAVARIRPDAVINELTSLPRRYTPDEMGAASERHREVLSRLRLVNQRIGFLRFAAAVDLHGVWHGWEVSGCGER